MKKGMILVYLALAAFSASLVNGSIVFNNDFRTYNIGDTVDVEGYIESGQNARNIFRLYLECGNSIQILAKTISVSANSRYFFSEDVNLPVGNKGQCSFKATFNGETQSSRKFEVTDTLKGDLFLNKKNFKLGESLEIEGDVLYLDNDKVNGVGIFSLVNQDSSESYFSDTLNIEDGSLSYSTGLEKLPPRIYNLVVEAYDSYGNFKKFDLGTIEVTDKLSVNSGLDKRDYLPGGSFTVNLMVNEAPREFRVKLDFDGEATEQSFKGTEFNYQIKTKENIKSGQHTLSIRVNDDYGNYYEGVQELIITPVAKRLEINLDKSEYLPEGEVEVSGEIFDQGNERYEDGIITIRVLDFKENEIANSQINSGNTYTLELKKYAAPGSYKVTAEGSGFKKEITFNVNELEKIDAYYEENRLKISNEGNTEISDSFVVYLDDKAITNFNLKSKPSEIKDYDLRALINEDKVYSLKINFKGDEYDVGDALIVDDRPISSKITGAVVGGGDFVVYALLLLIMVLIILFVFYNPSKRKLQYERDLGYKEGQERLRKIREQKIASKAGSGKRFGRDMNKKDVEDFKKSFINRVKE